MYDAPCIGKVTEPLAQHFTYAESKRSGNAVEFETLFNI